MRLPVITVALAWLIGLCSPCPAIQIERANYPGLIKYVDPEYPPALYRHGVGGKGVFLLKINTKTGEVDEVKVIKSTGYTALNELAAKAFLQWKFKPGGVKELTVPYEFYVHGFSRVLH